MFTTPFRVLAAFLLRSLQQSYPQLSMSGKTHVNFYPSPLHPGLPPAPHDLWSAWSFEPALLIGLALAIWSYAHGVRGLWRQAGYGRGVRPWQAATWMSGIAVLVVALVSPLDRLGTALFSAHMVQHLLLILVAPPLLVLGRPLAALAWALPQPWRPGVGVGLRAARAAFDHILFAWILHAAALWAWHLPTFYEAALRSEWIHALEHISFFGTALLFWWTVLHPRGGVRQYGLSLLALITMSVQSGLLGALLTFASRPWYLGHARSAWEWGLTALEDQQLAGLIMWAPAGFVYLLAMVVLGLRWLAAFDKTGAQAGHIPAPVTPLAGRQEA